MSKPKKKPIIYVVQEDKVYSMTVDRWRKYLEKALKDKKVKKQPMTSGPKKLTHLPNGIHKRDSGGYRRRIRSTRFYEPLNWTLDHYQNALNRINREFPKGP